MGGTTSSYTYSPTPFGWGNGEQALKCTKTFPGGALNYASGPCTTFFPYKVGRPLRPVTHFKRTWSKFAHFHVTAHSIPQFRPHRGRSCAGDGASGWRLTVARPPETHKGAGAAGGRGGRGAHRELASLGVSKNGPPPTGEIWVCRKRFGCVEKFDGVETGPPRPRRPFWHPPPPPVAGEGLLGRPGTGPWGSGAGSGPLVVKIYLWYEPWWCGPTGYTPSSKIYIWSSGRPRLSSDDEGPGCPPMPRPPGSPMATTGAGRQDRRGPGRGWAAPAPPPTGEFRCVEHGPQAGPRLRVRLARAGAPPNWSVFGCVASPPPPTAYHPRSSRPRLRPRRPSPHRQLAGAPQG